MMSPRRVGVAAVLPGLCTGHAAAQSGRVCQGAAFTGERGAFVLEINARNAALAQGSVRVAQAHGLQWANWANATDRSSACFPRTTAVGANLYRGTVTARPCIYP